MGEVTRGTNDANGDPDQARQDSPLAANIQREADIIAKAHADIDAGHGIEDSDMETWLDKLDDDPKALPPLANRQRHAG
jgi:hypothetical protein